MQYRPLRTRVLVRGDEPETKIGSIIIPDVAGKVYSNIGTILAVGSGVSQDCPPVGSRVYFKRRPGSALAPDDREPGQAEEIGLVMLQEEDLLAVIE